MLPHAINELPFSDKELGYPEDFELACNGFKKNSNAFRKSSWRQSARPTYREEEAELRGCLPCHLIKNFISFSWMALLARLCPIDSGIS